MDWVTSASKLLSTCQRTFGEACTFTPVTGSPASFSGIFDAQSKIISPTSGLEIMSSQPKLFFLLTDLPQEPKASDLVTVRGTTYKVLEIKKDGQGGAELRLHKS